MAEKFVLLRVVNMRGVDLQVFDFDFDLTWAALFMNADNHVYGRYGSRDEGAAEAGLSLAGLKYAMGRALEAFHRNPDAPPVRRAGEPKNYPRTAEKYSAARRLKAGACIHCHQVYNFRHELLWNAKKWNKDRMWVYPPPKSVGIELKVDRGDKVAVVKRSSPSARAGLRAGDVLKTIDGIEIASAADVRYALHYAPKSGSVPVTWNRGHRAMTGRLKLAKGWRKSDISWRGSMWSMPPVTGVYGKDLTAAEKRKLGLGAKRLAFRMGKFVPKQPRQAGIRANDVIVGTDDKPLEMTMLRFNVFVRENYDVGDRITFNLIRAGQRLKLPMVLTVRTTW